jgi:hypothetical protein
VQNKKGFFSLIAILVIVLVFMLWFVYLWNHNWFGGGLNVPSLSTQNDSGSLIPQEPANSNPGDINKQLNRLRTDVKNLENKKNQEINDELNK